MNLKKNTNLGKINFFKILLFVFLTNFFSLISNAVEKSKVLDGDFVEVKILDKVSSKSNKLIIKIGEEKKYKNLIIKFLKCKNSEFDDNPEITAYLQVRDLTQKENDKVFVFNDWTFASSPSISPFDHPVYDIWLIQCY